MSNRNVAKGIAPGEYYHVNIRGGENLIYLNESDYYFFLSVLKNLLVNNDSVEALVYCLEPSHFDLLLFQSKSNGVKKFLNDLATRYNRYFYEKYDVDDLLFKSNYKITNILSTDILEVSRRIHLAPNMWIDYPHSSIRAYFYQDAPDWLNRTHIVDLYGSAVKYLEFMES